ncbi:component of the polarisome [Coemansia interrupta]|uniref:Component of the polarisome n=1 Tax=Coemansia interrupta TaxID=1126814 RepID=A0A9W8HJN7_9FUNG|nr:component of the polarisome [Coemansia interrupta]
MEATAGQYHREMSSFILDEIEKGIPAPAKFEPAKLSRLSPMQFQELATDVYDELKRRRADNPDFPFLPVRDHYHPKRNQARQKLATLSPSKFVDLVHDVNEELKRRFPQKIDSVQGFSPMSQGQHYDSMNMSNMYSGLPGQQQQYSGGGSGDSRSVSGQYGQYGAQPSSYNQYQPRRSPPTSSNSAQGFQQTMSASSMNMPTSGVRSGSFANDDALDNVERAASDLSYAIHSSQQAIHHRPSSRVSTPDRGIRSQPNEVEKIKNEYEMRLTAMRKRVGQLESQLLDIRGDGSHGKDNEQMQNLERLNDVLTQKNERLENELKILRDQLVTARTDIPALRQENDKLRQERSRFIDRERDLKAKLDEARAKVRKLKTTSVFAMDHGDAELVPPPVYVNSGGVIRPSSVRAFHEAVESLLVAVRSESMESDLPVAQSSIMVACEELKTDIRAYQDANAREPSAWPLPSDSKESIPGIVQNLDTDLRGLAIAVDKHISSMGVLPLSFLEAAASQLATSVVELVKMLKVCYDETKAAPRQMQAMSTPMSSTQQAASGTPGGHRDRQSLTAGSELELHALEVSTDDIISGIQNLLQLMRMSNLDPNALYSTLHQVVVSIRSTIGYCHEEFDLIQSGATANVRIHADMYDPTTARGVLEGLEKGHLQLTDQLNDIREAQEAAGSNDLDNEIVRELLDDMVFRQRLKSALLDVGKSTQTLVRWVE